MDQNADLPETADAAALFTQYSALCGIQNRLYPLQSRLYRLQKKKTGRNRSNSCAKAAVKFSSAAIVPSPL